MTQFTDMESQPLEVDETTNIMEYVAVCRQRIWLIVSLALVVGGGAGVWSYMQIPIYQASAKIVIEEKDPMVIDSQLQQEDSSSGGTEQIETHIKLMTSYPVLQEVVERLNLTQQPEYQARPKGLNRAMQNIETPWIRDSLQWGKASATAVKRMIISSIKTIIGLESSQSVQPETEENFPDKKETSLVLAFKNNVAIWLVKGSKMVEVSIQSEDPEFAAFAANILAQVYIERNLKRKSQFSKFASDWFASQLANLRGKVEGAEQVLHAFRVEHGLVNLVNQQTAVGQRLSNQSLESIAAEKVKTETQTHDGFY